MRLYTIEMMEKQTLAVEGSFGNLYSLESLGITTRNMNELIDIWEDVEGVIKEKLKNIADLQPCVNFRVLAPIPIPKQDIICLGVNYREHIEEIVDIIDFTKKTDTVYFSKRVNRCNDPGGTIPIYDFVDSLDYEVELGVIIKKDAYQVKAYEAKDYIFGYTIINDVSARNLQLKHKQWYLGKSLDGYTPMGPCIVTADEIADVHNLNIACFVNDEKRQNSNTRYMITSIEQAIEELTQGITLKSGTIIATGTPGGVAKGMNPPVYLKKGDKVRCEVHEIGVLENIVGC